jgi:hypothetical protein
MAKGRKKPLQGAKKYDRAFLTCTTEGCKDEFLLSKASTPAKRKCSHHAQLVSKRKDKTTNDMVKNLRSMGLIK